MYIDIGLDVDIGLVSDMSISPPQASASTSAHVIAKDEINVTQKGGRAGGGHLWQRQSSPWEYPAESPREHVCARVAAAPRLLPHHPSTPSFTQPTLAKPHMLMHGCIRKSCVSVFFLSFFLCTTL